MDDKRTRLASLQSTACRTEKIIHSYDQSQTQKSLPSFVNFSVCATAAATTAADMAIAIGRQMGLMMPLDYKLNLHNVVC